MLDKIQYYEEITALQGKLAATRRRGVRKQKMKESLKMSLVSTSPNQHLSMHQHCLGKHGKNKCNPLKRKRRPQMYEHMIHIAEFKNEFEAEVACGHLKSAGIEAIVLKDDAGGMLPSLQETEGVSVCVLPEDMKRAKVILHEKSMATRQ
jgi:hypothetical protein